MNASHVLRTPELLFQILSHSNNDSVVKGMQVCQFWFAVGKPIAWRAVMSQKELKRLLLILIPYNRKVAIPSDGEWKRFLQYSTVIRHLLVDLENDPKHIVAFLEFLINTRPIIEVFPALETLECKATSTDILYPFIALLHSGVQRWIFDVGCGDYTVGNTVQFEQLGKLAHVKLGEFVTVNNLLHALEVLPRLETIHLRPHAATYAILVSLSRCPTLKEIRSNRKFDWEMDCDGEHHLSSRLGAGAFPSLVALTISGCPYSLSKLLDDENFPFHVRSLAVEIMRCADSDPGSTYRKIAAKCPAVVEFVLHDTSVDSYSPFTSLRAFLSLRLTRLVVKPYYQLSYDAIEIEELVRSLPLIEDLDLGTEAKRLKSPMGTFTFDHLPLFSLYCPNLTRLAILLDVSKQCNPSPPNLIPFPALRELDLHLTFAFNNMQDVDSGAILLSKLLPAGCRFICEDDYSEAFSEAFRQTRANLRTPEIG